VIKGRTRRLAVAAAAIALIVAGAVAVLASTARADTEFTCQGSTPATTLTASSSPFLSIWCAKIVVWACDPAAQGQGWTYHGDELRIHGDMCVNAKGRGTKGSPLILWPCNGSPNEIWIRKSNGEYALKADGYKLCLTDPAFSTHDGTQAAVGVCSDARDQRWSLP
jgi:ricin-type beta-trefoil lectin protein